MGVEFLVRKREMVGVDSTLGLRHCIQQYEKEKQARGGYPDPKV